MISQTDLEMMTLALEEADKARDRGDYAIGAVVARGGDVLVRGGNRVITKGDSIKHVEIELLQYAVGLQPSRYLPDCTLYSTHAPCPMCLTACIWTRIGRVVYAVSQHDIEEFGKKHGTGVHKWRGTKIEPEQMYERYLKHIHPHLQFDQTMREECLLMMGGKVWRRSKVGENNSK